MMHYLKVGVAQPLRPALGNPAGVKDQDLALMWVAFISDSPEGLKTRSMPPSMPGGRRAEAKKKKVTHVKRNRSVTNK